DGGTARHVVGDAGQAGAGSDGLEVAEEPFLRRLVVVRHRQQQAVRAQLLALLCQLAALGSVVVAGARDDGAAVADSLLDLAQQAHLLLVAQRRRFAGRAKKDDAVASRIEECQRQALGLAVVQLSFVVERRDHRRQQSADFHRYTSFLAISSSAICMALRAAPLRRLSPAIHRATPFGSERSSRMRPTNTSSRPAAVSGIG